MKKIVLLVLITLSFMFINLGTTNACSCIQPLPPQESLENATAVFVGKVVEVTEAKSMFGFSSSLDPVKVKFDVSKSYKGISENKVAIETAMSSASCGYNFEKDKEYIVYAHGVENDLNVSLCSRTALLSDATEDIIELGEGNIINNTDNEADNDNNNYLTIFFLSLAIIVLIVFIILIAIRNRDMNK